MRESNQKHHNTKLNKNRATIFIVWKAYQRRVESFCERIRIRPIYIHYKWEEKTKAHKIFSYFCKTFKTLWFLLREKPHLFYVQGPPTFPIYVAYIYSLLTKAKYVVDAHNTLIYGSFWCRMPFVKYTLNKSIVVIVHNKFVADMAYKWGISQTILMDRPTVINRLVFPTPQTFEKKSKGPIVVIPCSYDRDEPLEEMRKATTMLPDVNFFVTWFREKLSENYLSGFRENTKFTGFLPSEEFDSLLAHSDVIMVLTNQIGTQPSGASEALSFKKPLVVSDLKIIRDLFPIGSIYVENSAEAIANGIVEALQQKERLAMEMASFMEIKLQMWEKEFQTLIKIINP